MTAWVVATPPVSLVEVRPAVDPDLVDSAAAAAAAIAVVPAIAEPPVAEPPAAEPPAAEEAATAVQPADDRPAPLLTWFAPVLTATELPRRPNIAHRGSNGRRRPSPYSRAAPVAAPGPDAVPLAEAPRATQPPRAPYRWLLGAGAASSTGGAPGAPALPKRVSVSAPPGPAVNGSPPADTESLFAERQPAAPPIPSQLDKGMPVYTWIPLRPSLDNASGDTGRQVSRYMVTIHASLDLPAAIRQPAVIDVLHRLVRGPEDRSLRDRVVTELAAVPCPPRFATTIFDLSILRTTGEERPLDGLLVLRNQGVQVGLRPGHGAYVITTSLQATELLEGDPELSGALVDHLCPAPSGVGNGAAFDKLLRKTLEDAGDEPVRRTEFEPGTVLRIEQQDGANGAGAVQVRVRVQRHLDEPDPALEQLNGEQWGSEQFPESPDRLLELDPSAIELHPSLGEYLAALVEPDPREQPEPPAESAPPRSG